MFNKFENNQQYVVPGGLGNILVFRQENGKFLQRMDDGKRYIQGESGDIYLHETYMHQDLGMTTHLHSNNSEHPMRVE
jgi:hypothetical protein